jgi:hypothetical protein
MSIKVYKHGQMPKIVPDKSVELHRDFGSWLTGEDLPRLQAGKSGKPSAIVFPFCLKDTERSKIVCALRVSLTSFIKTLPFRYRHMKLEKFANMLDAGRMQIELCLHALPCAMNLQATKMLLANLDTAGHDILFDFTFDDIAEIINVFAFKDRYLEGKLAGFAMMDRINKVSA